MRDDTLQCLLMLAAFILGALFGTITTANVWKKEVVVSHHAEWVADSTGEAQFKWKEAKP